MTASAAPRSSAAELVVETRALDRVVGAAERDRPPPDALDEREQLGSGLLGDDLAEQRPEQPDLDARAGRGRRPSRSRAARRRRPAETARRPRRVHAGHPEDRSGPEPPPDRNLPGRNLSLGL